MRVGLGSHGVWTLDLKRMSCEGLWEIGRYLLMRGKVLDLLGDDGRS